MKQYEAVIEALESLGGLGTLGQLNQLVPKVRDCQWHTKTPFASIRRIVQTRPEIYRIKRGLYGLVAKKRALDSAGILQETARNKTAPDMIASNHTYYQGLLLLIGRMKSYDTFAPRQDRGKRFLGQRIGDLPMLPRVPPFSYPQTVKRTETIDVIWFNPRQMPGSLFEVEFSTDIQNSLLKFADLQDFYVRMFIVADRTRRSEYGAKLKYTAFNDIRARVEFLDFESVVRQYELMMEGQAMEVSL